MSTLRLAAPLFPYALPFDPFPPSSALRMHPASAELTTRSWHHTAASSLSALPAYSAPTLAPAFLRVWLPEKEWECRGLVFGT